MKKNSKQSISMSDLEKLTNELNRQAEEMLKQSKAALELANFQEKVINEYLKKYQAQQKPLVVAQTRMNDKVKKHRELPSIKTLGERLLSEMDYIKVLHSYSDNDILVMTPNIKTGLMTMFGN